MLRTAFLMAEELFQATNPGFAADLGIGPGFDELLELIRRYLDGRVRPLTVDGAKADPRDIGIYHWRRQGKARREDVRLPGRRRFDGVEDPRRRLCGLPREAGWNAAGEDRARAVSRRGRPGHEWFVHRQALLVGEGGHGRRRLAPRPHPPVSGASNTADTSAANPSSSAEAAVSPRPYRPCSTYASPRSTSTVSVSSRGSAIQYSGILASA